MLITCDPSIKSIIVDINNTRNDIIVEDIDDTHLLIKESMVDMLKRLLDQVGSLSLRHRATWPLDNMLRHMVTDLLLLLRDYRSFQRPKMTRLMRAPGRTLISRPARLKRSSGQRNEKELSPRNQYIVFQSIVSWHTQQIPLSVGVIVLRSFRTRNI